MRKSCPAVLVHFINERELASARGKPFLKVKFLTAWKFLMISLTLPHMCQRGLVEIGRTGLNIKCTEKNSNRRWSFKMPPTGC